MKNHRGEHDDDNDVVDQHGDQTRQGANQGDEEGHVTLGGFEHQGRQVVRNAAPAEIT